MDGAPAAVRVAVNLIAKPCRDRRSRYRVRRRWAEPNREERGREVGALDRSATLSVHIHRDAFAGIVDEGERLPLLEVDHSTVEGHDARAQCCELVSGGLLEPLLESVPDVRGVNVSHEMQHELP